MPRLAPDFEKRARDLMALYPKARSALLPLCHLAQEQDGYLTEDAMEHIAELVDLTPAEVLSVASFYDMFHLEPVGTYVVGICTNIACLLNGGEELLHHAEESLGIRHGDTTADGSFTLEEMECIAHCDKAPCLQVNSRYFGPLSNRDFDDLCGELKDGKHKDTVPTHGALIRTRRDGGLRVSPEQIASERSAMTQAQADRAAAVAAEKARGDAEAAQKSDVLPKGDVEGKTDDKKIGGA
jgi:NADH-quinone oxidoreductase E subunit